MSDHGVPAHSGISQRPVSPDHVFRPHRSQRCFLRGCNSSNKWISWGFKPLEILLFRIRVRIRVKVSVMDRVRFRVRVRVPK